MDTLSWLLFESPTALGATLLPIVFGLLVHWRRSGNARPLSAGLLAAAALLIMQGAVITRREHAIRVLVGIEQDVLIAQTGRLATALAPDFQAGGMDRDGFIRFVERQYRRVRIQELSRGRVRIIRSLRDEFTVHVSYRADVLTEWYRGLVGSRWELMFVRTPQGWRIRSGEPLEIAGIERPGWWTFAEP